MMSSSAGTGYNGLSWAAAMGMLMAASSYAQQDFSTVEIITHSLNEALYDLEGSGGNIGVSVGEDGVFLIDDQYAPLSEKIIAAIRALGDQPLHFVFHTHHHADHTGGNRNMGKVDAVIVAHENVRINRVKGFSAQDLNIIHTGDVFRTTGYPRVDTNANANGSVLGVIDAYRTLIDVKTIEQIQQEKLTAGFDVQWSGGNANAGNDLVAVFFNELSAK